MAGPLKYGTAFFIALVAPSLYVIWKSSAADENQPSLTHPQPAGTTQEAHQERALLEDQALLPPPDIDLAYAKLSTTPENDVDLVDIEEEQLKNWPALQALKEMSRAEREKQLELQEQMYHQWKKSEEWQETMKRVAKGEIAGMTEYERFFATALTAGFGCPSAMGPNYLDDTQLWRYIQLQTQMRPSYSPETRYIALDEDLKNLTVSVGSRKENDLRAQEIVWQVIKKYDLSFSLVDDNTLYITKKDAE